MSEGKSQTAEQQMKERIAAILEEESSVRKKLSGLVSERGALEMELTKLLSGIDVGSVVRHGKHGECRVTAIERHFLPARKPWLRGNDRKKNGEWSSRDLALFDDWERVDV